MTDIAKAQKGLQLRDNCGVCGRPLIYGTEKVSMQCNFCSKKYPTLIRCPQGHYVCDSCHQAEAIDTLRQVLNSSTLTDPIEFMELIMSHPSVPMHGPEHHAMVPAVIVAAVRNAGYSTPVGAIEKSISRGARVPGGWCGSHGACGAAIGAGIAVSVLTEATPLTGKTRSMANESTSLALSRMLDGYPRCCKRASRRAIEVAIEFIREKLDIDLGVKRLKRCDYSWRNRECAKEGCPYFAVK